MRDELMILSIEKVCIGSLKRLVLIGPELGATREKLIHAGYY